MEFEDPEVMELRIRRILKELKEIVVSGRKALVLINEES